MAKPVISAERAKSSAAEFPLLARMDELVEDLRKHVPAALNEFDEEAIHDARVSTRRLKAALDLLEPVLSKGARRPFARTLRNLRRRLGPLRDLDVMLGHLEECASGARHAAAAAWLCRHLRRRRQESREQAAGKAAAGKILGKLGAWWGLRQQVIEAREAVASLLAESLHLQLDAFAEQAERVGDGAGAPDGSRAAAPSDGDPAAADRAATDRAATDRAATDRAATGAINPHELRIAGKALRYTLEMAAAEGHALPSDVAKTFKKMQEALGLWHDFVVLSDTALSVSLEQQLSHHDAALQAAVLDLARSMLLRASKELGRFSALWRERGEELSRTVRAAFPLTRSPGAVAAPSGDGSPAVEPAAATGGESAAASTERAEPTGPTEPQTGPGPCGSGEPEAPAETSRDEPSAV